ncbi:restriction endonuclease subunit S [Paenibacillus qinlingensis]|uniref:restriction endonuclease subunit S n=1 Tax=Paenibacillus qinlingensis TaxID=1837343 RepID=UPI00156588B4|nr:restriction endonuclease subunit S [Paenibacillus qinlingensis]NQX62159.1 restriction endonuclease subunit S [Paenibacillus qinlingensis]
MSVETEKFEQNFGKLASGWSVFTLSDVCLKEKGSIISGPFGSNISSKYFVDNGIPVIRGNNITQDLTRFVDDGFVFVTNEKADELNTYAEVNDLIFTAAGTIGQVGIITPNCKYPKYVISNKQLRARVDGNIVDYFYAYYWFASSKMNKYIKLLNTGSTIPLINLSILKGLPIPVPKIHIQKKIVKIIDSFDDKIELNNRLNKVMEQMVQVIFTQWFIDFEFPNENSEPYKSSGGEMEWCEELGKEIPKGWKNSKISDLVESVSKTYKFIKDEIIFLNTSDILEGEILHETYSNVANLPGQAKKSIMRNDILYSEIRPENKRYAYVDFDSDNYVVSTKLMVLRAKSYVDPVMLYFYLTNQETVNYLQKVAESRSGTFPQITFQTFESLNFVVAPEKLMKDLAEKFKPIFEKIKSNNRQNKNLSNLRDTLLPKLMSGEIDVSELEL